MHVNKILNNRKLQNIIKYFESCGFKFENKERQIDNGIVLEGFKQDKKITLNLLDEAFFYLSYGNKNMNNLYGSDLFLINRLQNINIDKEFKELENRYNTRGNRNKPIILNAYEP